MTGLSDAALALIPDREWSIDKRKLNAPRSYSLLDHGYVRVKTAWGSDEEIIETARMSTDKGFLGWEAGPCPICDGRGTASDGLGVQAEERACAACEGRGQIPGDAKLLKHLYEHKHSTPFEFAGLTVEVQAPLMVFREWHRHRTQSYSEMSARYVRMPNIHYVPSIERIVASSRKQGNKQASGLGYLRIPGEDLDEQGTARRVQGLIRSEQARIYDLYEQLLSFGVAKEIARVDTPVSRYSRMRATGNLRNWLAFLTLRMDPAAQFEIRQYAWCVSDAIALHYPRTYELFFKDMLPILEPDLAPRKLLGDSLKALEWTSGAPDFAPGGMAETGWAKVVDPVLKRLRRALGKAA